MGTSGHVEPGGEGGGEATEGTAGCTPRQVGAAVDIREGPEQDCGGAGRREVGVTVLGREQRQSWARPWQLRTDMRVRAPRHQPLKEVAAESRATSS